MSDKLSVFIFCVSKKLVGIYNGSESLHDEEIFQAERHWFSDLLSGLEPAFKHSGDAVSLMTISGSCR